MSFDFFNSSNLAWGNKLTAAFRSLNTLKESAFDNVAKVLVDLEYYNQFINRNYSCPRPTKGDMPCRSDEILELISNIVHIKSLEYVDGKLKVELTKYNRDTNKITIASGETNITKGFAFVKPSKTNNQPYQTIRFSEIKDALDEEVLLFNYRVDVSNSEIFLIGDLSELNVQPCDCTQYRSMSRGETVSLPYKPTGNEAICVVTTYNGDGRIYLNGTTLLWDKRTDYSKNSMIIYAKEGDTISGSDIQVAFKINYNK